MQTTMQAFLECLSVAPGDMEQRLRNGQVVITDMLCYDELCGTFMVHVVAGLYGCPRCGMKVDYDRK